MPDVVRALVRQEEAERRRHQLAYVLERAGAERSEEGLQFGKRLFDRIEVGAVGREKPQARADVFDRRPHLGLLVHGKIIEHHHIARPQRRDQDLLDIGAEGHGIDRPIEDGGGGEPRGRSAATTVWVCQCPHSV